tara:strand:+ start:16301 stop:16597 length:297 start_codon:yes stop_codon:yes gene_type:complete
MLGILCISCNSPKQKEIAKAVVAKAEPNTIVDKVTRGQQLVASVGCNDCHSPKIMTERGPEVDPDRRLSGHPSQENLTLSIGKLQNLMYFSVWDLLPP